MKRKLIISIAVIAAILLTAGGIAWAADWISSTKSENNTVTIGSPLILSVERSGAEPNTGLQPGGVASFALKAKVPAGYKVQVTAVTFVESDNTTDIPMGAVWKFTNTGTDPTGGSGTFDVNADVFTSTSASEQTFTLKLLLDLPDNADIRYSGAKLTFTLEVVPAA